MKCENNDLKEVGTQQTADTTLSEVESLLNTKPLASDDVGDRCFSLLGGRVIFGLLVGEVHDSFLVALASTLISNDGRIEGKLLTASPVIRLFKNGVAFMSTPELEHRYLYYRHITQLTGSLPEFFNSERMAKIESLVAAGSPEEQLNRSTSPSDSATGEDANPGLFSPYYSTTRH